MITSKFFTLFYPVIESLGKGSITKKVMSIVFRFIGVLNVAYGIYILFNMNLSGISLISLIVNFLLFLVYLFIYVQIWFFRAKAISKLEESNYTAILIFSNIIRVLGEYYTFVLITEGLLGSLRTWFSLDVSLLSKLNHFGPFANYFRGIFEFFPDGTFQIPFIGGLLFLIITLVVASFVLLLLYFLAENILVLVEIAKNTRGIKKETSKED